MEQSAEVKELIALNKQLITEMASLRKQVQLNSTDATKIYTMHRAKDHNVKVRTIDGKVVVAYNNIGTESAPSYIYTKEDPSDKRKQKEYIGLILEDSEDVIEVGYKEFRTQSEKVTCFVEEIKKDETPVIEGLVEKQEVKEYSMQGQGYDVPLEHIIVTRDYLVKISEGHSVWVNEGVINIA